MTLASGPPDQWPEPLHPETPKSPSRIYGAALTALRLQEGKFTAFPVVIYEVTWLAPYRGTAVGPATLETRERGGHRSQTASFPSMSFVVSAELLNAPLSAAAAE